MRKLTLAFLTSGGLTLGVATLLVTMALPPAPVLAGPSVPFPPGCLVSDQCNGRDKAQVCHFDEGHTDGHILCVNSDAISSHISVSGGALDEAGHNKDFCAAPDADESVCVIKEPPPK
jgi:hypothetical protein